MQNTMEFTAVRELSATDIMSRRFLTIRAAAPLRELAALLAYYGQVEAAVLDPAGRLRGTASAADLFHLAAEETGAPIFAIPREPAYHERTRHMAEPAPPDDPSGVMASVLEDVVASLDRRLVEDIIAPVTLTISPSASTSEIACAMLRASVERVPVVRGDRMIGVVSLADLLRAVARPGHTRSWEPAEPYKRPVDRVTRTDRADD